MSGEVLAAFMILPPVIGLGGVDLAIDATRVDRVADRDAWEGDTTIDVAGALGVRWRDESPRRVLVLSIDGRVIGIAVTGKLLVRSLDRRLLQPLPPEIIAGRAGRSLAGIVFPEGELPVLALDCRELAT